MAVETSDGAVSVGGERAAFGGYLGGAAPGLPDGSGVDVKERGGSGLTEAAGCGGEGVVVSPPTMGRGVQGASARGGRRLPRPARSRVPGSVGRTGQTKQDPADTTCSRESRVNKRYARSFWGGPAN